ncbi:uncharacterized protein LOC132548030 [Ylistrum balloti]|uniref:uncharacterized protein LOC132548030 n=1 Tax=Ylistrum balloti TaxID=509963 RepID=UPI0029059162|nr:uncharacterized protein LOC132548030 [Ylistrum balloti]
MGLVSSCPEDKIGRVIACLTSLTGEHENSSSALLSEMDVREMEKYCRGGSTAMLDCITVLFDNCTKAEDRQILVRFADRQRLNSTFIRFCENFDVYSSNSGCISSQEQSVHSCIEDSKRPWVPLGPMHRFCRHFKTWHECRTGPVTRACGRQTGEVIGIFLQGITPPICQGYLHRDTESTAHVSSACYSHLVVGVILSFLFVHSLTKR